MREAMFEHFQAEKQEALLFLAVGGVALTAVYSNRQSFYAVGVGLIAQATFMLVLDLFAAHRGRAYLDAIARLG